jgi:hypothetical protein
MYSTSVYERKRKEKKKQNPFDIFYMSIKDILFLQINFLYFKKKIRGKRRKCFYIQSVHTYTGLIKKKRSFLNKKKLKCEKKNERKKETKYIIYQRPQTLKKKRKGKK